MVGGAVYYDLDKVFTVGGAVNYDSGLASNRAYIIDMSGPEPVVERQPNMIWPRAFINTVVLPNGWIVCAGGQMKIKLFADTDGVLPMEIFDPVAKRFYELQTPLKIRRNYHSVGLLVKDGRVLIGGGGLCGIQCDYGTAGVSVPDSDASSSLSYEYRPRPNKLESLLPLRVLFRTTPTLRS